MHRREGAAADGCTKDSRTVGLAGQKQTTNHEHEAQPHLLNKVGTRTGE